MDCITIAVYLVTTVLMLVIYKLVRPDPRHPPCPVRPVPLVGHLLVANTDQRPQWRKWREQCSDIFSLHMGSKMVVVLNGYDLIKETLMKRGEEFSDRPHSFFDTVTGQSNVGIVTSSGDLWKEQRSVTLQLLRKFGFGNNVLANRIQEEVTHYLIHLSELDGQPIDIALDTKACTSNIICSIIFGQRFGYQNDVQKKIFHEILENVGTERVPTEQDKAKLNYLNAAIMETQRLASITPNAFLHTCPRDVTIRGYTIPKGTYIMPYLDSVLHDEKIWENDVMSFRPERFLD
ncbi:hypothetical protein Btru_020048 [Bulinus truncatus]|nr:hypothetical protein Btru_020048 [Bulinus truncatus]